MSETATICWASEDADLCEAARFFARVIAADPAYISHGEIQTALSPDGATWAPDLERRFLEDLRAFDPARGVALAREGGAIVAAAVAHWATDEGEAPYGVLEDLAVDPARRNRGMGERLVRFIEAEAHARDAKWLFLESGRRNHRAHAFFERAGFAPVSTVFAKKL